MVYTCVMDKLFILHYVPNKMSLVTPVEITTVLALDVSGLNLSLTLG